MTTPETPPKISDIAEKKPLYFFGFYSICWASIFLLCLIGGGGWQFFIVVLACLCGVYVAYYEKTDIGLRRFKWCLLACFSFVMLIWGSTDYSNSHPSSTVDSDYTPSPAQTEEVAQAEAQEEPKPEIVSVKASQLFKEFEANEARATSHYKGKRIKITGVIDRIEQTFDDEPVITLKTPHMFLGVQVHLLKSEWPDATKLDKGQQKTWLCEKADETVGMPQLTECTSSF